MTEDTNEKIDIARAWKDEAYRNSLTPEQLAQIPTNPAGEAELDENDLDEISSGGANTMAACAATGKFMTTGVNCSKQII